jgi:hypothetical protein
MASHAFATQGVSKALGALAATTAGVGALAAAHALPPLTQGFAASAAGTVTRAPIGSSLVVAHSEDGAWRASLNAALASWLPAALCLERVLVTRETHGTGQGNGHGKAYVVDVRTFASTFGLSAMAIRAALNLGVSYSRVVNEWLEEAAAIEEEARAHESGEPQRPLPKFEWEQPMWASVGLFVRESVVVTTRRAIEKLAVSRFALETCRALTPRVAAKLLKDVPRSARRKCERLAWEKGKTRLQKAASMALTSSRAALTRVCAELAVASAISAVACRKLYQLRKSGALPPPPPPPKKNEEKRKQPLSVESEVGFLYARLVFGHVVKGACLLAGGAAGAGVVALARKEDSPKWAARLTFLGVAAGEAAGSAVAAGVLGALFAGNK